MRLSVSLLSLRTAPLEKVLFANGSDARIMQRREPPRIGQMVRPTPSAREGRRIPQCRPELEQGRGTVARHQRMHDIANFFRRNPQALALLIICVVLGIGTFIAILIAIASSPSRTGPGYPNGTVAVLHTLVIALAP